MGNVIVLMTDFGLDDWYVGAMKGAIKGISPEADIVDLSHNIPPGDIQAAALNLLFSYTYFPEGTVFCLVIDPGVGTERGAIVASDGAYFFTAPNNGVLSPVKQRSSGWKCYTIENKEYTLPVHSHTFHGRDIFSPAAAHIAGGVEITSFGSPVEHWVDLKLPVPDKTDNEIRGEVIYIDRFGNIMTNISAGEILVDIDFESVEVNIGKADIKSIKKTFADVSEGEALMFVGSSGNLEIGINGRNAAKQWQITPGTRVVLKY